MKITAITKKGSGRINEDTLLIGKNIFGVFDGATGLIKYTDKKGNSGGKIASETAKTSFAKNNKSLLELAKAANRKIMAEMKKAKIKISKENNWTTTIAVVRIQDKKIEYLQLTDSLIIVVYADGAYRVIPEKYHHDLETLKMWKTLAAKKVKEIRQYLYHQLLKVRREQNIKYGSLNGNKKALGFIKKGSLSKKGIKQILLITDGLIIPKQNPDEKDDIDKIVRIVKSGGLKKLLNYVRALEKKDPNCWKYPRFKQYDDATGILIELSVQGTAQPSGKKVSDLTKF